MRILKFRAWHKERKMWLPHQSDAHLEINSTHFVHLHNTNKSYYLDCNHLEVTQFTGLKDNNGKEIYEGDWCRFTTRGAEFQTTQGVVEFYGSGYKAKIHDLDDAITIDKYYEIEVIGNIYENKELLNN